MVYTICKRLTLSALNCRGFFSNLIDRLSTCMIYHLNGFHLCIPKIASASTKKVIDLTNDGLKSKKEKVKKSQNLHIYIRYTPKPYFILQLSGNR